mgnify:CR=1 FL=1|jgi:hypothetical protein
MLNDEDAINDVNPFVQHDFSLPGSVRQSGGFSDFSITPPGGEVKGDYGESVYCSIALCATQDKPTTMFNAIHPRRNIDTGFTCDVPAKVNVGVAKQQDIPYIGITLIAMFITLAVSYARP